LMANFLIYEEKFAIIQKANLQILI